MVTVFNRRKLLQGRNLSSFFFTICSGEAQGKQEHLMMRSSSMVANSFFATANFSWLRRLAFAYNGWDVQLHPVNGLFGGESGCG